MPPALVKGNTGISAERCWTRANHNAWPHLEHHSRHAFGPDRPAGVWSSVQGEFCL